MKQLVIIFAIVMYACSTTAEKNKDNAQSQENNDSFYVKKGYKKFESKHNFSFYYSTIWRQLGKEFFESAIKASYKELDPSTDYEAGFNLINDKDEYIFPRFHLETNLTAPPSMKEIRQMFRESDLVQIFEDDKKESWNKQLADQVKMLSNLGSRIDEKKHIIYFTTTLKMEGQGDLYCLSVLFLGKKSMASIKFFLPLKEKDKYLPAVTETIESFHYGKEYEYKN